MNWETFDKEIGYLADQISPKASFDVVVGIARGGIVPARILASQLAIPDMYCLNVRKEGNARVVTTEIKDDLSGRTVLLVEDVLETGGSLEAAKEYMKTLGAAHIGTADLYYTARTKLVPDYSLGEITEVPVLPWE